VTTVAPGVERLHNRYLAEVTNMLVVSGFGRGGHRYGILGDTARGSATATDPDPQRTDNKTAEDTQKQSPLAAPSTPRQSGFTACTTPREQSHP
jgi:hypothetical protein